MPAFVGTRRALLGQQAFSPYSLPSLRLYLDAKNEASRRGLVAPILSDGFSRADDATGLGTAPTGQVWTEVAGNWSIASGTARCDNTAGGLCLSAATMFNGRLSARTRSSAVVNAVGSLAFRYIDSSNYLVVTRSSASSVIAKIDGGASSILASTAGGATNSIWDRLEVRMSGNQIDLYLNGTLTVQHTLSGADATKYGDVAATGIGLRRANAAAATVEYDDVVLSTGESALLLSQWSDDSGNGFHFSQATATKQPLLTYMVSAGGALVPVIRFDGVDDLLVRASIDVSSALQGWVHAAVGKLFTVSGDRTVLASADEGGSVRYMVPLDFQSATGLQRVRQRANDTESDIRGSAVVVNTSYLLDHASDGAVYALYRNGSAQAVVVGGGDNNGDWFGDTDIRDNFAVGALKFAGTEVNFLSGDLHSIILTDAAPTASQVRSLAKWDNARYQMGVSL